MRHNSSGPYAFTGKLKRKEIHNAISLHPIKQAPLMYRLHSFVQVRSILYGYICTYIKDF